MRETRKVFQDSTALLRHIVNPASATPQKTGKDQMSFSILGSGAIGRALATQFARNDIDVLVANRRGPASLVDSARELGRNITAVPVQDALRADVYAPLRAVVETFRGDEERGRVFNFLSGWARHAWWNLSTSELISIGIFAAGVAIYVTQSRRGYAASVPVAA